MTHQQARILVNVDLVRRSHRVLTTPRVTGELLKGSRRLGANRYGRSKETSPIR